MQGRNRNIGADPSHRREASAAPRDDRSPTLTGLVSLLDHAVRQVPAAGYFWGVVAANATVAIISRINGLNKVTFIAILAAFVAMFIFYVFSRMEKATDPVVKLVGHALLIISGLAFIFVIVTSAWLALFCSPRLIAYLYGVSEFCSRSTAAAPVEKKTAIYRNTIRRNGTWEGRDQITPEEAGHLGQSSEIVSVGDPPRAIEINLKNGSGFCPGGFLSATGDKLENACSSVKACTTQLSYKQDGTVDRETRFDQFGNVLEEMVYPSPIVGEFVDAVFPCDRGRSGIQLLQFERVASGPNKGLDEVVRFLDKNRHPKPNDVGNYDWRKAYDAKGHVTMLIELGPGGENWGGKDNVAITRSEYDDRGLEAARFYSAPDDHPTSDKTGIARQEMLYDKWGNEIEVRFIDLAGKLALNNVKVAGVQRKFDDRGNPIETADFGVDKRPTLNGKGYAGWPIVSKNGYAGWRAKFDERGNQIETTYFGLDDKAILSKDGYAVWRAKYDERDNQIETSYFRIDGQPILSKDGYSGWRAKFDERGNRIEIFYFGLDGQPTLSNDGYAGQRTKFDERGHEIERAYFGTDDKLILGSEGYAVAVWKYDSDGREIVRHLFDTADKPVKASNSGRSIIRTSYDQRNLKIEESSFDEFDQPVDRIDEHWSLKQWLYDPNGQLTKILFRDKSGQEIPPPTSG
jgi:hypothetical protein